MSFLRARRYFVALDCRFALNSQLFLLVCGRSGSFGLEATIRPPLRSTTSLRSTCAPTCGLLWRLRMLLRRDGVQLSTLSEIRFGNNYVSSTASPVVCRVSQQAIAFGGMQAQWGFVFNDTFSLDLLTMQWTTVPATGAVAGRAGQSSVNFQNQVRKS